MPVLDLPNRQSRSRAAAGTGRWTNRLPQRLRAIAGWISRATARLPRWGGAGLRDRLAQRLAGLADHDAALRRHGEDVEKAFVGVGAALHEQTRLAGELVAQGRRFSTLTASDAGANPVHGATALIAETIAALETLQQDGAGLLQQLSRQHEDIARLRQKGAQLERAIAPLRIVDTLFRIEAAGLPVEMQTAFSALTQDIARLDQRVRDAFLRHFDALGTTREAIGAVIAHFTAQRAEKDRLADAQRTVIKQTLASLESELAWLRRHDMCTTEVLAHIDRETNGVVVALQYQDITRQKLEHVRSALSDMAARLGDKSGGNALAFAAYATRLEACQLAAIDEELQRAADSVDLGLRQVVVRLGELERNCLEASDYGEISGRIDQAVRTLSDLLNQLRAPMERALSNAGAATRAVQSFGGLTADLGETIRELTWGIRLIALNAQVQAAQVDRCDGLEVLARHTYLVSEETSRYGDTLGQELSELHGRLGEVVGRAEKLTADTHRLCERFEADSQRIARELSTQRDSAREGLQRFGALFRQTRHHAQALLERATLASVDREPLRRAEADLREVATWCTERARGAQLDAAAAPEFAALQRDYTMAAERDIHRAVLNGDAATDETGAAPTTAAVPIASLLDQNVELF